MSRKAMNLVKEHLLEEIQGTIKDMPVKVFEELKEEIKKGDKEILAVYCTVACVVVKELLEENKILLKRIDK